jgi:addiction module HigA family antidote
VATANFSVPSDVKEAFDKVFRRQNKSAVLTDLMRQAVDDRRRQRRAVSPKMALRLSRLFGNSPEFWLNAQRAVDLWEAARNIKDTINHIFPLTAA